MTRKHDDTLPNGGPDAALAPYLSAALAERPQPSGALMTRIMADAIVEQPRAHAPAPRGGRAGSAPLQWFLAALGGWPGLGGLGTAALAGLWIGSAAPGPVAGVVGSLPAAVLGGAVADEADILVSEMLPDFADFLTEG